MKWHLLISYCLFGIISFESNLLYGNSGKSNTTTPQLVAPSNLSSFDVSSAQIGVRFQSNSTNESGHEIERSQSSSSGFLTIVSLDSGNHSYIDQGLNPGSSYYYRVRAFLKQKGKISYSAYSEILSAKTLAVVTTPPPTTTPPASSSGIWISKAELDQLSITNSAWAGKYELKATADEAWIPQAVEQQSSQFFNIQAMAGALVYARLHPDPAANAYRIKVAKAIRDVMSFPDDTTVSLTGINRHLGTWPICADLINLKEFDPALDSEFRKWLTHKLDVQYLSGPKTVRLQIARPDNHGSWASFSLAAASAYLGDRATLDTLATRMRRYMGDTKANYTLKFGASGFWKSWHVEPNNSATWVGINPKGATKNGHNLDGIQPSDQDRGFPEEYDASNFPNDYSAVRYNEVSMQGLMGALLILHRAGYTDLLDSSDQAILRAARWMKQAADNYPYKGYKYFSDAHEASRPMINYFYNAGLPEDRVRSQRSGRAYGFSFTYWTHQGRRLNR
jgi:hypothetical protein